MSGESYGAWRDREIRRIAGELAAIEAVTNAHWLTRWVYRLITLRTWRPWR